MVSISRNANRPCVISRNLKAGVPKTEGYRKQDQSHRYAKSKLTIARTSLRRLNRFNASGKCLNKVGVNGLTRLWSLAIAISPRPAVMACHMNGRKMRIEHHRIEQMGDKSLRRPIAMQQFIGDGRRKRIDRITEQRADRGNLWPVSSVDATKYSVAPNTATCNPAQANRQTSSKAVDPSTNTGIGTSAKRRPTVNSAAIMRRCRNTAA